MAKVVKKKTQSLKVAEGLAFELFMCNVANDRDRVDQIWDIVGILERVQPSFRKDVIAELNRLNRVQQNSQAIVNSFLSTCNF